MNTLVKYNKENDSLAPFHTRFGLELDSLFNGLFDSFWSDPSFVRDRNWKFTDITQDAENYNIEVELPGVKKSELDISARNNTLKVSAKNARTSYTRSFSLEGWDLNRVKTKLEDGVLYLTIPKTPESRERKITVE